MSLSSVGVSYIHLSNITSNNYDMHVIISPLNILYSDSGQEDSDLFACIQE